jgi:hypothetical protein
MNIDGENYSLEYDESANLVSISGSLRLNGLEEYKPILDVLNQGIESGGNMQLDLSSLEFLNSSGIAMLSKFIINARGKDGFALTITGSAQVPWQGKSLKNLQRLWPALELTIQ